MNLKKIIRNIEIIKISGNPDIEISDICYDSRNIKKGDLFVCLKGTQSDGHDFIKYAIEKGARAIAVENDITITDVCCLKIENTRKFLAKASANFFNHPTEKLTTIGITGTKGKTTTSFMIKSILEEADIKTGVIGTIGAIIDSKVSALNNTTPESYEIQKNFFNMVNSGCKSVVVEASSIGLKNHRLDGFEFDYGIFTNFSHDHIGTNEHKNMEEYLKCKNLLFKKCKVGIINIDDLNWNKISENHTCTIKTFGIKSNADYQAGNINLVNQDGDIGVNCDFFNSQEIKNIHIAIPGKFNVYNALAAWAVCDNMKISIKDITKGLSKVKVKGRVEPVKISNDYSLFIDYAHNAISMENVLSTLRLYNPKRLVTLFGAGGNRPKIRRYEMGEISGKLSDLSIITSDNPRFEDPMEIIEDIKKGINKTSGKYIIISDRKKAIKYCIENAQKGDIIVLAGKGHEDYQEIKGEKYYFDERNIIKEIINK